MMKKNKNILIILSIGIVLIISMFFAFNKSYEYHELPKVKVKDTLKNKQFALMLEQDNGEYQESEGELPTEGYVFNANKSGCTDINGKIIDGALNYDYATYTVLVDTSKTSYCYLYYDKEPNIGYLRSKDNNSQLTKELTGGMYRYQGADNVFNWICFGTSNQEECKRDYDKYMYRIIGITPEGQLYLLKETFLKESSVTGFSWNDESKIDSGVDLCPDRICPEWNEADLFQRINGTANGSTPGNGNADDLKDDDTDIFVDSTYYDYLKSGDEINGGGTEEENGEEQASEWYNLIADHDWYYGDTLDGFYNGNTLYDIETGKAETTHFAKREDGIVTSQRYTWDINKDYVKAKVSLMYLHDYAYAYPIENSDSNTNVANSWIFFQKDGYNSSPSYEWLSTRYGFFVTSYEGVSALNVPDSGVLQDSNLYYGFGVRPVFYVSNKVKIANGDGTKESPYILEF